MPCCPKAPSRTSNPGPGLKAPRTLGPRAGVPRPAPGHLCAPSPRVPPRRASDYKSDEPISPLEESADPGRRPGWPDTGPAERLLPGPIHRDLRKPRVRSHGSERGRGSCRIGEGRGPLQARGRPTGRQAPGAVPRLGGPIARSGGNRGRHGRTLSHGPEPLRGPARLGARTRAQAHEPRTRPPGRDTCRHRRGHGCRTRTRPWSVMWKTSAPCCAICSRSGT